MDLIRGGIQLFDCILPGIRFHTDGNTHVLSLLPETHVRHIRPLPRWSTTARAAQWNKRLSYGNIFIENRLLLEELFRVDNL
jgi:hypothetical protein